MTQYNRSGEMTRAIIDHRPKNVQEGKETNDFTGLETKLGITFSEKRWLQEALTHRSYLNEHRDWPVGHNERMEFLGDAILEFIVTEALLNEFPGADEGALTNWRSALVNSRMLTTLAKEFGIEEYIFLSRGEAQNQKSRNFILANALEAIIGAIYSDQGLEATRQFLQKHLISKLGYILEYKLHRDPKSHLQEIAQAKTSFTPRYEILQEAGSDHARVFTAAVYLDQELIATGTGANKKEAQVDAARNAIKIKGWEI